MMPFIFGWLTSSRAKTGNPAPKPQFRVVEVPASNVLAAPGPSNLCKECGPPVTHWNWTIQRADGSLISRAWPDEILARDVCDLMNEAFDAAKDDG